MKASLSTDPAHWKSVKLEFCPDQSNPTFIKLLFVGGPRQELIASLPRTNETMITQVTGGRGGSGLNFSCSDRGSGRVLAVGLGFSN
jgi:hypothetical protein